MHKKVTTTTFSSLSQKNNDGCFKPNRGYMVTLDSPNELVVPKPVDKKRTELYMPKSAHQIRQGEKRKLWDQQNPIDEDDDFQTSIKLPNKTLRLPPKNIFPAKKTSPFIHDGNDLCSLKIPKKASSTLSKSSEKSQEMLQSFNQAKEENESNADKVQCPFCLEHLTPMTRLIEKALAEINDKDKKYEKAQRDKELGYSSFSRPTNIVNKRPVSSLEKDTFCRLHKLELVTKPEGIKMGYPSKIDFDALGNRIQKLDVELKEVIQNVIPSDYRKIAEDAYKLLGTNKARSTIMVMNRFEKSLPGYYGPKGANVILEHLVKMYMNTGYLEKKLVSKQLPLEFLQQVLVPEAGYRLIRQDLYKSGKIIPNATNKAKSIMEASRDYGNVMFPVENHDIEDVEVIESIYNVSDNEEEEEGADEDSPQISL